MSKNRNEKEQIIDFLKLCLKHWYYFLISGVICLAIGILYIKVKDPVYSITSQVTLSQDNSLAGTGIGKTSGLLSVMGMGSGGESVQDETIKLGSQGNIKEVVKNLGLNINYKLSEGFGLLKTDLFDMSPIIIEANPIFSDSLSKRITMNLKINKNASASLTIKYGKEKLGNYTIDSFPITVKTKVGDFSFSKSSFFSEYENKKFNLKILYTSYDYMAQLYRKDLDIDFYKKTSDFIGLSYNSENIATAKKILTEIINSYNKNWSLDKEFLYTQTINFIEQRLLVTQEELIAADQRIQEFKDKNNLTTIEADVSYYFTLNGGLQKNLLETRAQLSQIDMIKSYLLNDENKYALVPYSLITSESSISNVIEKYNEELTRRNEFKDDVQSIMLQSIEKQLELQRKNLILSLDNVKKGLEITLETIREKESELEKALGEIPSIEKEYLSLRREQEYQQTVYMFLLEKREETAIKYASLTPKLKLVDVPYVLNKPVSPSLMKTAFIVLLFGGCIIPLSLIYLIPHLKRSRKNK